jgi:transcriptional regulator with XRE-family HTH domain
MSTEKTLIQKTLIEMRRRLNLKQKELAACLKVSTVTVGRWESTRSPEGASLAQLAGFAARAGDTKSAEVFRKAATYVFDPADVALKARENTQAFEALQASIWAQAPAKALEQIRAAARRNSAVHAEYVKVLQAILRAYHVLSYQANEALKGKSDFYADLGYLARAQTDLREELENAKKQNKQTTKTER